MNYGDAPVPKIEITPALVRRLVAGQFPQWADLPITPVEFDGWDNRTFRLGAEMSVRLPSAPWYILQVEKEQRWLPYLAPHLPLPIPVPLAQGQPAGGYPFPWSIYRWQEGEIATVAPVADPVQFALDLAQFLAALQRIDPAGGPPAGAHNFYRGGDLAVYDGETWRALAALGGEVDAAAAGAVWRAALQAAWHGPAVWVHGDVAAGNLLVQHGRLSAVIDFGSSSVGDPACDLTIAWTFFSGASRAAFRAALPADAGTWARARGWALWKGLITLAEHRHSNPVAAEKARQVIVAVLADHAQYAE
jgi:aminoglycoside phosphotransferase (APT) family kinase protein